MSTMSGGRTIVVKDARYRWKVWSHRADLIGNSPPSLVVTWQAPTGGTAQAHLLSKVYYAMDEYNQEHGTHKVSLGPSDVRKLIEHALQSGWDVKNTKTAFEVKGPLDLKDYAL